MNAASAVGDKFTNRLDANIKLLGGKRAGDVPSPLASDRIAAFKKSGLEQHWRG